MNKGVALIMVNGDKDWIDPVDFESGLTNTETHFVIDNGYHVYEFEKTTVKSLRWYDLCPVCGSELYEDGCHKYHEDEATK